MKVSDRKTQPASYSQTMQAALEQGPGQVVSASQPDPWYLSWDSDTKLYILLFFGHEQSNCETTWLELAWAQGQ